MPEFCVILRFESTLFNYARVLELRFLPVLDFLPPCFLFVLDVLYFLEPIFNLRVYLLPPLLPSGSLYKVYLAALDVGTLGLPGGLSVGLSVGLASRFIPFASANAPRSNSCILSM